MRKKWMVLSAALVAAILVAPALVAAKGPPDDKGKDKTPGYRVKSAGCEITVAADHSLDIVCDEGSASVVMIQWMKKLPGNVEFDENGVAEDDHFIYLDESPIPEVNAEGRLQKFFTDANIGTMTTTGVHTLFGRLGYVQVLLVEESAGKVQMTGMASDDEFATASIVTSGTGDLQIQLTGIVLESLTTSQDVKKLKLSSKKFNDRRTKEKGTSMGGLGRVTPEALADEENTYEAVAAGLRMVHAKGAPVAPDLLRSDGDIGKIQCIASKNKGQTLGGVVGRSDEPTSTVIMAPNVLQVYGAEGVYAKIVAGANADGDPDYSGEVKKISTKPRTGDLDGEVHLSPSAAEKIKFVPDQGGFEVFDSAP